MNNTKFNREAFALKANIRKRNNQLFNKTELGSIKASLSQPEDSKPLTIFGGNKLVGSINISGSKNSALPIIFASILCDEEITLLNVPHLSDTLIAQQIIEKLGAEVAFSNNTMNIRANNLSHTADTKLVQAMRASFLVLGPLLAKYHKATIVLPGGCSIGDRPVDIHLACLSKLGAHIEQNKDNLIIASAPSKGLVGNDIHIKSRSVGATENTIMAAVLAKGTTRLFSPAKEPEISDLANFLNSLGAHIKGAGTDIITIKGVDRLKSGGIYRICPDRIEAGSYAIAAAATRGEVTLNNLNVSHLSSLIEVLKKANVNLEILNNNSLHVSANGPIRAVDINTQPYPGFPTDLQPQWVSLMLIAQGVSTITENIFNHRLGYIDELKKFRARIEFKQPNSVTVHGGYPLSGTTIQPMDLRASFALVISGLIASGKTILDRSIYLNRGYENIVQKLTQCGAVIW